MSNFIDISGQRFGMLTVTSEHESRRGQNGKTLMYWKCICDCGREIWTRGTALRYGTVKSCNHHERWSKHRMTNSRLYTIYNDMKQRCNNPNNKAYAYYGGRGIRICDDWLGKDGFSRFSKWALENGYSDKLTIDRIDVNGNYEPSNCRWADDYTQKKNRRNSIYVKDGVKEKYLLEAANDHNIEYSVIKGRLDSGWNESDLYDSKPLSRKVAYQGEKLDLKELSKKTGIPYNTLQSRFNNNFTDEEMVKPSKSTLKKPVCQYSLDGQLIAEFDSATDASKETGIRLSGIIMCCNHQRNKCGGYRWEHQNVNAKKREERCLRRKENGGWIDNRSK